MSKQLRLALVGVFFVFMFAYDVTNAYLTITRGSLRSAGVRGWIATFRSGHLFITSVDPGGPATDLRAGDEITAFDGRTIDNYETLSELYSNVKPGGSYTVKVRRDNQQQDFTLQAVPIPFSWWASQYMQVVVIPAVFILVGLTVFLLRPNDKHAIMLALMFGMAVTGNLFVGLSPALAALVVVGVSVSQFKFPLAFHFFLIFPKRSPILCRYPRLEYYLYLPHLIVATPYFITANILAAMGSEPGSFGIGILYAAYLICSVISASTNYRHSDQAARRKLRVVMAGTIAGVSPLAIWIILQVTTVFLKSPVSYNLWNWVTVFVLAATLLIPASFTYAILRHQVIPVSLIIRRGVQYVLARNALRIVLVLPAIALAITILSNPNRTLKDTLVGNSIYLYLLIAAALSLRYRKRLTGWIDRKFFREVYNQEKILRQLIDETRNLDSIHEMSKRVIDQVERALHPLRVYLFYRQAEDRDLSLGYSSGGIEPELRIPEEFRLLRFIEGQATAQDFPFPKKSELPQNERDWLSELGTSLIVPMSGTDGRLAGVLLLGEKKSEVPYTASDRELLETLAGQMAIVYENVRLRQQAHRDFQIRHEVLARLEERNINLLKECQSCGACFDSSAQFCEKDKGELILSLPVERTISGRYRLDQLIGRGGMGAVYEAADLRLNRKVAVKIMVGSMFGDVTAMRRFEREAQASARLNHPNIISVYDYGMVNTKGAYLVMELVHGETLHAAIKRNGRIPPLLAAEWFDQVLHAVKAAHQEGVIHRDLKPENVLLSVQENGQPLVKVLDFGLAKIRLTDNPDDNSLTEPGTVVGTLAYMSPEQLAGKPVDERSDIFALGVVVVEALTGQRPFAGKTHNEVLGSILREPFHLTINSRESQRLDAVLQKCLAKNPKDRFVSIARMQQELIPALRNCSTAPICRTLSSGAETISPK